MGYFGSASINDSVFFSEGKSGACVSMNIAKKFIVSMPCKVEQKQFDNVLNDLKENIVSYEKTPDLLNKNLDAKSRYQKNLKAFDFVKVLSQKNIQYISCKDNILHCENTETNYSEDFDISELIFFDIDDLFINNGVDKWGASLTIKDKEAMKTFVKFTQEHLETYLEKVFMYELLEQLKLVDLNKDFVFSIGGSF